MDQKKLVDKIKADELALKLLDENYKLKLIAQQLIFKEIPEDDIDSFFNGLIRGEYNLLLSYLSGLDEPITSPED